MDLGLTKILKTVSTSKTLICIEYKTEISIFNLTMTLTPDASVTKQGNFYVVFVYISDID